MRFPYLCLERVPDQKERIWRSEDFTEKSKGSRRCPELSGDEMRQWISSSEPLFAPERESTKGHKGFK